MILFRLAAAMATLSVLSFGGANAILPQMHADIVDRQHWITSAEFARFWALGQMVPGPTLSSGALVGYVVAGVLGAAIAAFALYVPGGIICFALASAWDRYRAHPLRDRLAAGFAPVVLGLIWAGSATLLRGAIDGNLTIAIAVVAAVLILATKVNRVAIVVAAGVAGYALLR